jgi:hypothetical protein
MPLRNKHIIRVSSRWKASSPHHLFQILRCLWSFNPKQLILRVNTCPTSAINVPFHPSSHPVTQNIGLYCSTCHNVQWNTLTAWKCTTDLFKPHHPYTTQHNGVRDLKAPSCGQKILTYFVVLHPVGTSGCNNLLPLESIFYPYYNTGRKRSHQGTILCNIHCKESEGDRLKQYLNVFITTISRKIHS